MHRVVRFRSAIAINNKNRDNINNNNNETDGRSCEGGGLSTDRQIVGVCFLVVTPELRNWRNDLTTRRVRGESVLKLSISIALSLDLYVLPSFFCPFSLSSLLFLSFARFQTFTSSFFCRRETSVYLRQIVQDKQSTSSSDEEHTQTAATSSSSSSSSSSSPI
jgi:hypothetical protein